LGLADEVVDGSLVALDTSLLIYYVEANPLYLVAVEPLFDRIIAKQITAHASLITLIEVLVRPLRENQRALADRYRDILQSSFAVHEFSLELAEQAAALRAEYGLRTPDAIICATALGAGCAFMITNDDKFDRVAGIRTLKVDEYV
jgi:predicted nucleic acid-binding protein